MADPIGLYPMVSADQYELDRLPAFHLPSPLPPLTEAQKHHRAARADMIALVYKWSRDEVRLPDESWHEWEARIDLLRACNMAIWEQAYPAPDLTAPRQRTLAEMKADEAVSPWKRDNRNQGAIEEAKRARLKHE